ncbi:proteoglycan 4-like isoform X2 [Diorhabda carinulata]|uniref:proteoglycan 4-like isoform X2 n=1 Tax=Diorhabda carinulata TaxID=1163345 RepID=UPI0025A29A56|nr:proteoglycan 4-like isoform X2 [Diorhabda carinulata]
MGGYAWVTLATNDSYSLGALVLAHSLKQVATQQQLAVLITPGVTNSMRSKLGEIFNVVKEVNILDSKDEANLRLLKRPELGITFTKLHCWRLTQFEKCVFLDADTLVLENCDELFEREELSAAPDIGWPDCFNSGVFVYRPSEETYEKLINFALEKGSFDGGDQGLLNLYFSDWAHKDISKHLPFIYNMASTSCYSYLPAFKQFGKSAKILHFIGSSKPWLQYFNTETRKVHPSEGLQHLEQILQHWWNIFCNLIHPALSPDMTSHTDTVHGSQSYTSQSISHTSYYHEYEHNPNYHIPENAEDYQNVWDPWEEYDSRQSGNKPPDSTDHENSSIIEHSQSLQPHYEQYHHSSEKDQNNTSYVAHAHVEQREPESHYFEYRPAHSDTNVEYRAPESRNEHPPIEHHNHFQHSEHRPSKNHNNHQYFEQRYSETQNHHQHKVSDNHHHFDKELHSNIYHSEPYQRSSRHLEHQVVVRQVPHNKQQNLIESHNTNTFSKADHHVHIHHPSAPTYSQPQIPIIHHRPPETPNQDCSSCNTPPDDPRLPDECVATTTVSNEITLQSDSNEDSSQEQAGLAGAFANLTLGKPRTPEQQALDDHLRRQGWEVGNIDYLGRDSFDNIWSKICETLSLAPEPAKTAPLLEPDKTEFSVAVPASRIESKEENKLEATAELLSDRTVQENKSAATLEPQSVPEVSLPISNISDTIIPKVDSPTTTAQAAVDSPTATFQVAQVQNDAKLLQTSDIAEPSPEQQEMGKQLPEPLKSTPPPATTETISKPVDNLSDKKIPIASETTLSSLIETQPQSPESPIAQEVIPEEASKVTSMEVPKDVQAKASEVISVEPEITESVDPINQEVSKAIPTDESKSTPADSFKVTPADSFKAIPAESPKTTPADTSKDTPVESLKATPAGNPEATPTDNPKTTSEEIKVNVSTEITSVKTAPAEILKTSPAEISADTLTAAPVETPKSPPKDPPKVSPTETIKDAPKPKPSSPESLIAKPSEMSETAPIESVSTVPVETSKATSEILESVPVETPKSTPTKPDKDASVEVTKVAVPSTTMDASVKTSKSVPTENVKAVPKGTQKVETAEAPKGESKKSEESVPKKVSKGKQTPETKEVSNQARQKETTKPPASKVTEPTPPTTPGCPTPQSTDPASSPPFSKGGLQVEGSVPNTPPAQEAASGPTPPPRKSASAPKKAAKKK